MNLAHGTERTDEDIILLIEQGDAQAFEALFDRHSEVAFSLAMRILQDRGLAAESTSEAFLALWHRPISYRSTDGPVQAWLLGTVRRRAIDRLRANPLSAGGDAGSRLPDRTAGDRAGDRTLGGDRPRMIRALLDTLPSDHRLVIELAYYQGLSHTEIARRLELPAGIAKRRMRLALEQLSGGLRGSPAEAAMP